MKAKKFNNLWTAGIILFISILITLHIIKLVLPNFIVGVVVTPTIITFGQLVDSNKFIYYLFYTTTTFILLYFYISACCNVRKLRVYEVATLLASLLLCCTLDLLLDRYSVLVFTSLYIILPICYSLIRNIRMTRTLLSLLVCFLLLAITQILLWSIRGITNYISTPIYTVLFIDTFIVDILLYLYFNYKGDCKK